MARGGKRPGAGRKRGVPNRVTSDLRERLLASGQSPLEFLTAVYRSPEPVRADGESGIVFAVRYKQWMQDRLEAGKAVLPFYHPRLATVEVTGKDGDPEIRHRVEIEFVTPGARR